MATETDRKVPLRYLFGANTLVIGSGVFISGIGLLIADAVKFNPYRELKKRGLSMMPN